jgi:DNA polymerase
VTLLFHDTETFSPVQLRGGTHRYAEKAEVIIHAWAFDGGSPRVHDATTGDPLPGELKDALRDPSVTIVGHNYGNFDRTVLRWNGITIDPARIHDTMVQALSHGLPGALGTLCDIFRVPIDKAKDKRGKELIRLFCSPRPKGSKLERATRLTHPVEWSIFLNEYAPGDITSMQHLYKAMPKWNYPAREHALWCLDQTINDRGLCVDLDLADAAIEAVRIAQGDHKDRVAELTDGDVQSAQQRDALLKHLLEECGVSLPDMQKGTLERRLNDPDLPAPARELIAIRLDASTTSTAKYGALKKATSSDGRLRGTLQFCGAARTGRDAGRVFQPQNLLRPTMDNATIERGIAALKGGYADLVFDSPIKLASNAIRGSIVAAPGHKLVVSDLSNIEGRMLAWLAGEAWKLKAFADFDKGIGHDLYKIAYARSFNIKAEDVTKDQRQLGKVMELALGFQGAVGAFASMAALYGVNLPRKTIEDVVKAWREANRAIRQFWWDCDEAAREAINQPGAETRAGKLTFYRWREWLRMRLPSGRELCYSAPRIVDHAKFEGKTSISYMGLNNYTRKWERIQTYGGKLAENATQAAERDVLLGSMPAIEAAGFPIVLRVHDELLTEPLDTENHTAEKLSALMIAPQPWFDESLPLAAAGFETYRYAKH